MFKSMDIGIDLGTANILVYVKGKGVVLKEPSVVAIDKVRNKVLAVGDDAREMLGRAPGSIVAIRPLKEGVIANYTVTQKLLAYVIEKVAGKSLFFKPACYDLCAYRHYFCRKACCYGGYYPGRCFQDLSD